MTVIVLPNGREVDIDVNDPKRAAAVARLIFQREHPEEFAAWARQQPAGGPLERFGRGVDEMQGRLYGAAEAVGAATGIGSIERFGQEGRRRNIVEAEQALPGARLRSFEEAEGIGGVLQAGQQAIAGSAPELPLPLAAGAAGFMLGGIPGAIAGAALGSLPSFIGGNVERQLDVERERTGVEPSRIPAPGTAIAAAVPQAAVSSALDVLTLRLARVLGRPAEEIGSALLPRIMRGIGAGVVTEVPSEVLETAIERAQAGLSVLDSDAMRDYREAAAGAAFAGGTFGGVAGGALGRRPRQPTPPPPAEPADTTREPESLLPAEPEPFTTPDEAATFIQQTPEARPRVPLEGNELVEHANALRRQFWQQETESLRDNEISNFLGLNRVREVEGRRDVSGAAATLLPRLYQEATTGNLSLQDGFTVEELTNTALRDAGVVDLRPSELATVRQTLNEMANQGFLRRDTVRDDRGKRQTSYTVAPRNLESLRQMAAERRQQASMPTRADRIPGEAEADLGFPNLVEMARRAPASVDQVAANQAIQNLQQIANPDAAAAQAAQQQLGQLQQNLSRRASEQVQNYLGLTAEANQLTAQRQQLPLESGRPELLPLVQAIDSRLAEIQSARASLLTELEGVAQGTFQATRLPQQPFIQGQTREATPAPASPTVQVGRTDVTQQPTTTPVEQDVVARGAIAAAQERRAADQVREAVDTQMVQNFVAENPEATRNFLSDISAMLRPGARFDATRIQQMAAAIDVPMSRVDADILYNWARANNLVNDIGALNPPSDRPAAFADVQTGATPTRTEAEQQEARATFERVVGPRGKLTFEQTLFLEDLGAEVQAAAEAAGIEGPIAGYASGDMAVLSLADSSMPLNQVAIHEGWHVAENQGIIKADDIAILNGSREAILSKIRSDLDFVADPDSLPNNEVRAYGANARATRGTDFGPTVNSIFDRCVNMMDRERHFMQGRGFRSWRDVYDDFLSGRSATTSLPGEATFNNLTSSQSINFAAPRPISTAQQAQQAHQAYAENQINNWYLRNFASLSLTISKDRPLLRPSADVMQTFRHSRNEAINDTESRLEALARLKSPESQRKVMRLWQEADRTQKAPNMSMLNAEERAALTDAMSAVQRTFDWIIEAHTIDYFMPTSSMPQAQQNRLNNFWAKHNGKHLWEIPAADLRAASPQGFQEFQRYNRMRNPYKLPALADGSHFVAVYKKNAKGERVGKPLQMIAYNPIGTFRKFKGVANPEAIARAELQSLYPNANAFYITPVGREFTRDAEAAGIRNQADAISQFLNRLTNMPTFKNSTQARNELMAMVDQLDKAQVERIFQKSNNILRAVNNLNETSYGLDVLPRYVLGVANIQARRRTQEAWTGAIKNLTPADQAWLNEQRDYASSPTESFGALRTITFLNLLGFATDTALINSLQTFQITMPMMIRDGGPTSLKHFGRAYQEVLRATGRALDMRRKMGAKAPAQIDIIKSLLKNPQEIADYEKAIKVGTLLPLYLNESRGQINIGTMKKLGIQNAAAWSRNFNKVLRAAGLPSQYIEQNNRAATFLAAYRAAIENPQMIANKNRADNQQLRTPYDYATSIVDDTHFITDKTDRARFQRFTPLAEPATQFMSFVAKSIELYVRHAKMVLQGVAKADPFMAKAGAIGLSSMVVPLLALGGLWALPGFEFAKELLESILKEAWQSPQNFDADLRRAVGGGYWAEVFTRGFPAAHGVATLSRRLALDPVPFSDITGAQTLSLLLGPSTALPIGLMRAYEYWKQEDYMNMAASMSPRALGNVVKGADIGLVNQSIRSQRGNVLISPEQIADIDAQHRTPVAIRQALGFQAPEIMSLREVYARREELARQNTAATQRIHDRLASDLTDMMRARQRGDMDAVDRARQSYRERVLKQLQQNAENFERGRLDRVININVNAVQQRAQEDFVGRSSPQASMRGVPRNIRPTLRDELDLYDWRRVERERAQ